MWFQTIKGPNSYHMALSLVAFLALQTPSHGSTSSPLVPTDERVSGTARERVAKSGTATQLGINIVGVKGWLLDVRAERAARQWANGAAVAHSGQRHACVSSLVVPAACLRCIRLSVRGWLVVL